MKAARCVVLAGLAWSLAAFDVAAQNGGPEALRTSQVARCADVIDRSQCILDLVVRASPGARETIWTITGVDPSLGGGPADAAMAAERALLGADRRGEDLAPALKQVDALGRDARLNAMASVCAQAVAISRDAGPAYTAWQEKRRPSPIVMKVAADRLENDSRFIAPKDGASAFFVSLVAGCRAKSGDMDGAERAIQTQPQELREQARIAAFGVAGRWSEAFAVAERLKVSNFEWAESPGFPGVFPFVRLQNMRLTLFSVARDSGQPEFADRSAQLLLAAALGPERPANRYMASGLPEALYWLAFRGDPNLAPLMERADAAVRPGGPAWNERDAMAVHRVWLQLGRRDRAHSLLQVLITAQAADPKLKLEGMLATMAVLEGQPRPSEPSWFSPVLLIRDDVASGVAEKTLRERLAMAKDDRERREILRSCAAAPVLTIDYDYQFSLPPTLALAAECARRIVAEPATKEDSSEYPEMGEDDPVLGVAARAARRDDPALAQEMLGLALKRWSRSGKDEALEGPDLDNIFLVALVDLHLRGKL